MVINYIISQVQSPDVINDALLLIPIYPSIHIIDVYSQYIFNIISINITFIYLTNRFSKRNIIIIYQS